jgi:hypothetical protein
MIIRILGEGQLDVPDDGMDALNALDSAVEDAVAEGDEGAFAAALGTLLDGVRAVGTPLPEDSLEDSDLILPPADASIEDVRSLLSDDGLIPG